MLEGRGQAQPPRSHLQSSVISLDQMFTAMQSLVAPINTFFEAVLVEDKDPDVRTNRRALLQRIARLPMNLVDLSKVEEF